MVERAEVKINQDDRILHQQDTCRTSCVVGSGWVGRWLGGKLTDKIPIASETCRYYTVCNMIETETTLVLGAGASAEYGFPTGRELVIKMCRELKECPTALLECGFTREEMMAFYNELMRSGTALLSIDTFLQHRSEFNDLAKHVIAYTLLPSESDRNLFDRYVDNIHIKEGLLIPHWYRDLLQYLNTDFDKFGKNKLSIITFNYDRSFEYFFHQILVTAYGKNSEEAAEQFNEIPILHIHGKLGRLPWEADGGDDQKPVPYDGWNIHRSQNFELVRVAAANIKIIHEEIDNQVLDEACTILSKSSRIYFLGFGFLEMNVDRLKLGTLDNQGGCRSTGGTMLGLSLTNRSRIAGLGCFREKFDDDRRCLYPCDLYDTTVSDYLYHHADLS